MKSLLEGYSSDIMDIVLSTFKNKKKASKNNKQQKDSNYLNGSISNATKNLVMTFPTMCDNSLTPGTASMISKANERNIVTMLQLLFSSMQFNDKTGADVIAKIHKNMKISDFGSLDDAIETLEKYVESANLPDLTKAQLNENVKLIKEQMKTAQKSFPVESLSEKSLNEYSVHNIHGRIVVREAAPQKDEKDKDEQQAKIDALKGQETRDRQLFSSKMQNQLNQNADSVASRLQKQLLDSDIKKSNELQPTLMVVNMNEIVEDENGNPLVVNKKPFIAGIKSRLISVDSSDIIDRMIAKNKTKVNFLNFIRATTGEIKLVKDFLLCIDQAKIDAKNSAKKGEAASIWKALEYRSEKNFRNKHKKSGNDASAITTLVLNQETVNILKKEYDFDLERINNARMILDSYNLLGLFICDESIEVVKVLYNGNDMFEQHAYSSLERESNDSSYKKVINLIGKMNGR